MKYEQKVLSSPPRLAVRFDTGDKQAAAEIDSVAVAALAAEIALQAALIGSDGAVTFQLGRNFISLEHAAAVDVVRFLTKGRLAVEELEQAERIARDTAILYRSGAPLGLSNRLDIKQEAMKQAHWDSELRRYMPGGVRSEEAVGTPAIIQHPPIRRT